MSLSIVILAAGQGTRMYSRLPKVLHRLAGRTLLEHVHDTAAALTADRIITVYGHGGSQVPDTLAHLDVHWVEQREQQGTGHAVAQTLPQIDDQDTTLILYGDVPLTSAATLQRLLSAASDTGFALLTASLADPAGYGRIVRNRAGEIQRIVEQKDASNDEQAIGEVNTGMMAVRGALLKRWVSALKNDNAQGEYYLTDIIAMAVDEGVTVDSIQPQHEYEIVGINNRLQLAEAENHYRHLRARELMLSGVTLVDPQRFDARGQVTADSDVTIDINVILEGNVRLGKDVHIGAHCILRDVDIGDGVKIESHSVIEQATVGNHCSIGPFARIRPGTRLADDVHVGNFVEVKKSDIASGSKVNHLSYIGDTDIGKGVNVGAGTITCNYDGANKHRTVIEDNVFIGSDTQLVAPVHVARGATIAAGTTVTKDVDADALAISRTEQRSVSNWKRPKKK
ncbi:bifunctional UDP-N-acetylglucosamine pyrophosphorylase/glucosamine-1-phosphate N-acetyltransferase [Methylohalomonas lacus]|uniref:Bifunctional protein GlmU n=1 Tax=Methylohalomonas lacus TaxID=398773 RepID=A0AAE3HJI9_9GAMM|nr:bifunctional UDP-N-acetylglucosamine diphosphorylase/glucosamine-1-phosphate N-acetyltransferase GlmU [Methylohalomonas lacus]MCS3903450.1 bifunctional UDP-N-acetylglucosamine pyrophosphorylase/glucosamine-1-phosphate N-acetyltransferase [Methylohalomonas lacus]